MGRQSLLRNKIEGVTKGFLVYLRISGIGYRAAIDGQTITFKLGYSHDVAYDLPSSMRAFLPEPTLIGLYGIDKNQVTLLFPHSPPDTSGNTSLHAGEPQSPLEKLSARSRQVFGAFVLCLCSQCEDSSNVLHQLQCATGMCLE